MVRSAGPVSGEKLRIACPLMGAGEAESVSRCKVYCCAGAAVSGRPEMATPGPDGRFTARVNRSEKFASALSLTVIAMPKLPAAVGVPVICPVVELMVSPAGRPLLDHR